MTKGRLGGCAAQLMVVRRFDFGAAFDPIASSGRCFGLRFFMGSPRNDGRGGLAVIGYRVIGLSGYRVIGLSGYRVIGDE